MNNFSVSLLQQQSVDRFADAQPRAFIHYKSFKVILCIPQSRQCNGSQVSPSRRDHTHPPIHPRRKRDHMMKDGRTSGPASTQFPLHCQLRGETEYSSFSSGKKVPPLATTVYFFSSNDEHRIRHQWAFKITPHWARLFRDVLC